MTVVETTMPKTSNIQAGSSLSNVDAVVDELAQSLQEKLPPAFPQEETKAALTRLAGGPTAPLNIHLRQEIDRLNKVIRTVKESLRTLRLAIAGSIAMG
jgi:dynein heavy chain